MAEMVQFIQGEEVEVGINEKGLKGSWYAATVLQCSRRSSRSTASKRKRTLFVKYHTLMADKGVLKPLRENVNLSRVRPKPPQDEADRSFQVGEKVEVFDNEGWWEGTVTEVLENQRYRVHFKESNEEIEYHRSELRTHLEWIDGRWVGAAAVVQEQEISVVQHDQCRTEPRREEQSEQAVNTDQIIDLVSPLSLDATNNVAIKLLPIQAQARQDKKTFSTDMANPSSGGAVKNVASKKSHSPGISRKVDNQSSSNQAGSPSCLSGEAVKTPMSLIACPVRGMSIGTLSKASGQHDFTTPTREGQVKTPMSLIACPVRGMSIGTLSKASGQHDFTTPTREGQVTNVEGNRARSPVVDENVLDQLLKRYSKDHLEPLISSQDQMKHDLETNQPRNHPSVERCSSHLPISFDREENQLVTDSTKIQTLARQLKLGVQMPGEKRKPFDGDDTEQHEMERVNKQMTHAFYKRRHSIEKVSSTKGPESRETSTFVVQAEDTLKEIEMDGASNDNRDSEEQIAMCIEEFYLPFSIDELGASSANQPMVQAMEGITLEDAPMWGLELQNPLNVMNHSYSLGGINVENQPDEAIGDEHNECVMQSFFIEDETPREDESLPFVKCSPIWEIVEPKDIFHAMPQRLHFHPLKQFNMELREGLAIGLTLSFTNIMKKIGKAKFDDPMCNLQVMLNALEDLKAHGFNAKPIQARLEKLIRIKEEQEQISSQLVEAEEKINEKQHEKVMLETELEEIGMEMIKLQECLNEMKKKWNSVEVKNGNKGSEIAELKTTVNRLRERFQRARIEFNSVVADPW